MRVPLQLAGALFLLLCCVRPSDAQGVGGSTMRRGSADSLFTAFAEFVRKGEFTFERADAARLEVVFVSPKLTKERLFVRFVQRGDSTAISGQGADRGILGTVASLDAVRRFLVSLDSTAAPRDSTSRTDQAPILRNQ
jgi:hypothetical protein